MICDTLAHLARYKGLHLNLDTAIDYLLAHSLADLPLGRTEVDGEKVFINVMDADLQPQEGSHLEYHKKYADLQVDLTGGERWGFASASGTEVKPFAGDIGFVDTADAVTGTLGEERFALFFPLELHRPSIARPDCARLRKAVVKIEMEGI